MQTDIPETQLLDTTPFSCDCTPFLYMLRQLSRELYDILFTYVTEQGGLQYSRFLVPFSIMSRSVHICIPFHPRIKAVSSSFRPRWILVCMSFMSRLILVCLPFMPRSPPGAGGIRYQWSAVRQKRQHFQITVIWTLKSPIRNLVSAACNLPSVNF